MAAEESLDIRIERRQRAVIVAPQGEVDLGRSPELRTALRGAMDGEAAMLVIDLSSTPYMDSSGVATLVEAMQVSRRTGLEMLLCGLQDPVRSVLEIARLDTVFRIEIDLDAALGQG